MSEYVTLLRDNSNYRLLWLGSVVSQLGDWFNLIASDLLRAVTVLGFLLVREPGQVWLLYVLTFLQFALSAIFTPARSAVLANVVRRDELVPANALDSLTWSTMLAFGALLGGIVAATLGITQAFILDALTFVLSGLLLSRIAGPIRAHNSTVQGGGSFKFLDGLRYLRKHAFILGVSLVKAGGALAWGAINVLEITYATDIFQLDFSFGESSFAASIDSSTAVLGMIYAVSGLGTGLGPLFLRRFLGDAPLRQRWAISLGFGLLTLGLVLLSIAPTLGFFSLATLIRTIGSGTIWVFSAALLQMVVPDRFRGRVFAFEFAALTLTQSISTVWAGYAQDALGLTVQQVTFSMAVVAAVVGLAWLVFHLRHLSEPKASEEA
jgi:predicted MFS family arabinose efflux permease